MDIDITITVEYHQSENREALEQVFAHILDIPVDEVSPLEEIPVNERYQWLKKRVQGTSYLKVIFQKIRDGQIVEAVRRQFLRGRRGRKFHFGMNKQAAYMGKVHIGEEGESPLGIVDILIEVPSEEDVERLIDWLAPPTKDGHVLEADYDL